MKGWIAGSIDDRELRLKHYRPQGSSQQSIWIGRMRWGRGKYFMGSSPLFVLAASFYRMFEYPYIIGGLGILVGYFSAMKENFERYNDPSYLKFFRKYEFLSLCYGKRNTLQKYNSKIRIRAKLSNDSRLD
jgi:hypothetical protein